MKRYGEILKVEDSIIVTPLTSKGRYYETKDNMLIHLYAGEIKVLNPGDWAFINTASKKKTTMHHDFSKPFKLSPELSAIVGTTKCKRVEVIKNVWAFIKANHLQDQQNRRYINVGKNELTKTLFNREQISMFELSKLLSKHMFHPNGRSL